jgi:tRNA(Ile)-lysidine synthase
MQNAPGKALIEDVFERALEAILARFSFSGVASGSQIPPAEPKPVLALAYSGGLDSTVLLHLARAHAVRRHITLFAFHVHHGLSPNADRWLAHCAHECARLGVQFDARNVTLPAPGRDGVEQAARSARYAALGAQCRHYGASLLLTAHHQDDQAETVLLQLLRGAGIAGLSGMELANQAPALLGDPHLWIARPLLDVRREQLEQYAQQHDLSWIEDESNQDARYARNRLRHTVLPYLAQAFPGYQLRLARSARHAQSAQRLLDELGADDLQQYATDCTLDLAGLRRLGVERGNNLLRHWLASHGIRMPSTTWLAQLRTQALSAAQDAQVRITHPDCEVWRYRDRLILTARQDRAVPVPEPVHFRWTGEAGLSFPAYGGRLLFEPVTAGVDASWLRQQELILRHRTGGERMRLAENRPSRDLKHHFQSLGIPHWDRQRLPLVAFGAQLLYVAGIGLNRGVAPVAKEQGIALCWKPESG